jgi:pimeloyl-ACP methyl ester carboxylesterase
MPSSEEYGSRVTDAKVIRGFDERFADVRACRVRYFVGGPADAEPIVLIHGLGGSAANWVELAPLLAERRRVLVPDLPGHGRSTPLPAAPNLAGYADRVVLVAEREGLQPAVVVGHSMGGVVALRLALRRPDDVRALVLAGSAGIRSATKRVRLAVTMVALARPGRYLAPYRRLIARSPLLRTLAFSHWGAADPLALSDAAVAGFLAGTRLHTDTLSAAEALVVDDPREELKRIRCPVLVLWGARDIQLPMGDAFEYARRLRAPLRTIADCGHLLIGERPEACLDAIESFLG